MKHVENTQLFKRARRYLTPDAMRRLSGLRNSRAAFRADAFDVDRSNHPGARTFFELEAGDCRYPLFDKPDLLRGFYCGAPVRAKSEPYCAACSGIAYAGLTEGGR